MHSESSSNISRIGYFLETNYSKIDELYQQYFDSIIQSLNGLDVYLFGSSANKYIKDQLELSYPSRAYEHIVSEKGKRDLDFIVPFSEKTNFMNTLCKFGTLTTKKQVDTYLLNENVMKTVTYDLVFLKKFKTPRSASTILQTLLLEKLKLEDDFTFKIDVVYVKDFDGFFKQKSRVPMLSKNFYVHLKSGFQMGELDRYDISCVKFDTNYVNPIDVLYSLNFNSKYVLGDCNNRNKSGEMIDTEFDFEKYTKIYDHLMMYDSSKIIKRVKYVLEGNDLCLFGYLKLKYSTKDNLLENYKKFNPVGNTIFEASVQDYDDCVCPVCCESLGDQKLYVMKCSHILHLQCLVKRLIVYFTNYIKATKEGKTSVATEYNLDGSVEVSDETCRCPICRNDSFRIEDNHISKNYLKRLFYI